MTNSPPNKPKSKKPKEPLYGLICLLLGYLFSIAAGVVAGIILHNNYNVLLPLAILAGVAIYIVAFTILFATIWAVYAKLSVFVAKHRLKKKAKKAATEAITKKLEEKHMESDT